MKGLKNSNCACEYVEKLKDLSKACEVLMEKAEEIGRMLSGLSKKLTA